MVRSAIDHGASIVQAQNCWISVYQVDSKQVYAVAVLK